MRFTLEEKMKKRWFAYSKKKKRAHSFSNNYKKNSIPAYVDHQEIKLKKVLLTIILKQKKK